MRHGVLFCIAGGVIYAVALVATIPAPWISRALERASAERLLLRDPSGTLWSGSGRLYASLRSGPPVDLGALRWKSSWPGVFLGRLDTELAFGEATRSMQLRVSPGGSSLRGLNLEIPASVLAAIAPGLEAFGPQGRLRIRSDDLRLDADSLLGALEIEWRQVRLTRAGGLDLGSHVARLRGGGKKVDIELGTLEGPLRLSGGGTWTREAGLNLSGAAEHGMDQAATLGSFLQGICTAYRDRRCTFRLKLQ